VKKSTKKVAWDYLAERALWALAGSARGGFFLWTKSIGVIIASSWGRFAKYYGNQY
jgi:hypothetical protein